MNFEGQKNLNKYKKLIDDSIDDLITKEKNPKLREIFEHSLKGGKRIRPIISLLVFEQFIGNKSYDKIVNYMVLCPEIIHNISLIIDDLPSMDNDQFRREKETTHFKFGIIPSYISIVKLINNILFEFKDLVEFDKKFIFKNERGKKETRCFRDFYISEISDYMVNLIEGQYYDLQFLNVKMDIEVLYRINSKKTSPLFSLSFVLGYLMIIHFKKDFIIDFNILQELKNLGEIFGLIFQLNDDILDKDEDEKEGKFLNLALHLGLEESIKVFNEKCDEFILKLRKLGLLSENFKEIIILLKNRISNIN